MLLKCGEHVTVDESVVGARRDRQRRSGHNSTVDHERPLSTRGLKAARRMGKFLFRTDELPEQILCSSAVRTRQTLEVASTEGGWPEIPVSVENELYLTSQERILARLAEELFAQAGKPLALPDLLVDLAICERKFII